MSDFLAGAAVETSNTDLAAALAAVGIPMDTSHPIRRLEGEVKRVGFFFHSHSPCGNYRTRELMLAWDDPTWHERNPDHPFAYLMVGFKNRARLRDMINKSVPTAMFSKNGKIGFISVGADARTETLFFKELKRG